MSHAIFSFIKNNHHNDELATNFKHGNKTLAINMNKIGKKNHHMFALYSINYQVKLQQLYKIRIRIRGNVQAFK